ncbi:hypothetical protein Btru_022960 [Bulinus truncatus]|nr:hypothetical protein Btru_022960 [Bulinus truncatus]
MERRLITSPPNKQASSKWTQSDSDSQHISPVDEEASEHASKRCTSHWPIYVTALILGIILFSVGLYFTVAGHLSNEKDDVILVASWRKAGGED